VFISLPFGLPKNVDKFKRRDSLSDQQSLDEVANKQTDRQTDRQTPAKT